MAKSTDWTEKEGLAHYFVIISNTKACLKWYNNAYPPKVGWITNNSCPLCKGV